MELQFSTGDLVNIIPYDEVDKHFGIDRGSWENMVRKNPCEIKERCGFNEHYQTYTYFLCRDGMRLYWPGYSFAENNEQSYVSLVEVGDLL